MEALRIDRVSKNFGALPVLNRVSFTISTSEKRVIIIGPNGAGKTTLFNTITGELQPNFGSIYLMSKNITKMPRHRRPHLGLGRTFQIIDLFPYFTVQENVLLALQAHQNFRYQMFWPVRRYKDLYEKTSWLLDQVNLKEKKDLPITALSNGEMRLVELLMGMAAEPKILLLDEPAAGLTSSESEWLADIIKRVLQEVTVLMIEHDMKIAFMLAERIIVLHQGKVVADGKPSEIRVNPKVKEVYLGKEDKD